MNTLTLLHENLYLKILCVTYIETFQIVIVFLIVVQQWLKWFFNVISKYCEIYTPVRNPWMDLQIQMQLFNNITFTKETSWTPKNIAIVFLKVVQKQFQQFFTSINKQWNLHTGKKSINGFTLLNEGIW